MSEPKNRSCSNCKHFASNDFDFRCSGCTTVGEKLDQMEPAGNDVVSRPAHYTHGKFECIEVMEDCFGKETVQQFCLLNAFKYIWRTNYKNGAEDIKKARWYLDKYLELQTEAGDG